MPTAPTGANSTAASSAPRRANRIVASRRRVGSGRQDWASRVHGRSLAVDVDRYDGRVSPALTVERTGPAAASPA